MKKTAMAVITLMMISIMVAWAVPAMSADGAGKVNINTAGIEQLKTLDGIGDAYASRIVEYRDKNGPFQSPEDLLKIKGIGEKTVELNKDRIALKD